MNVDFATLSPMQIYGLMTQSVIPRPIAWVLSDNGDGGYNLAPFSYFIPVCSDPPLIALSIGWKDADTPKDTWRNIAERSAFVIHIVHREWLTEMNESSATLPHGESEVQRLGLSTVPFPPGRLPRLADARAAFACSVYEIRELGANRQALILGQVEHAYLADHLVSLQDGRFRVDANALDPVARLGPTEYAPLGSIIHQPRPS